MQVYIETYGCTANKNDQCTVEGILISHHHTIASSEKTADAIILLTCTVIDTTEQRMLSRIRTLSKYQKILIIAGCMPAVQDKILKKTAPKAHLITPKELNKLPSLLTQNKVTQIQTSKINLPKKYSTPTAPISIAEGCQQSCSYCITHFARGQLHSYPVNDIKQSIRDALQQDCTEIHLTAQDTASYGMDTKTKNLGNLLAGISEIPGKYRIRVGMMNPLTTNQYLSEIIIGFQDTRIYKFLHLPIQSGDDLILHKMNRGYTKNTILTIIQQFRKNYPDITLSTDIIAGFPQETENQHQNTIKFIKKIKPDIVNITKFSARPNTKAKSLSGRIPTHIVKQRSRELTTVCNTIALTKNKNHIGKKYTVYITKKSENNHSLGRTPNYKPVIIPNNIPIGKTKNTEIYDADSIHLYGNLINI